MAEFNFHTEARTVVERWGERIKGKTGKSYSADSPSVILIKAVVITGTSEGGLGATTVVALAHAQPSKIFLLARTEGKVTNVINKIAEISPSAQTTFISIELDDFNSVRRAAATILTLTERIDVLINNAGVMAIPWEKSKYGIEKTLAINHLGHFLLTKRLLPALIAAGPGSRVINLTSAGYKMGPFRFDDWNFSVRGLLQAVVVATLTKIRTAANTTHSHPTRSQRQPISSLP
jgi:NAD(P)-dependent dehydrogenase (short-subunit alcohol dehydrogenase family)